MLLLVAFALFVIGEGVERIGTTDPINLPLVATTALAALIVNGTIGVMLHRGSHHDVNVRGAFLHMVADACISFGVLVGAIVMWLSGSLVVDLLLSVGIGMSIIGTSMPVIRECVHVLLEGCPRSIDLGEL
jgi:cobalt-zinc-cadmium efflux system protein